MAKRVAIKGPKGDLRYFSKTANESFEKFRNDRKSFNETCQPWSYFKAKGYQCVQVEVRELGILM